MADSVSISRRDFLKVSTGIGVGLAIGVNFTGCIDPDSDPTTPFVPNAWVTISQDSIVTVRVAEADMGQGVSTALPMLVAEELDADWANIRIEAAPLEPVYGYQKTGGSTSIREGWTPLRHAGAIAREMLRMAASKTWNIPTDECVADQGYIIHRATARKLSYGELTETAASLPIPETVKLKTPDQFRIVGKSMPLINYQQKVNGTAIYGIDVTLPGILTATIKHCPVFGGKVATVNSHAAKTIAGVKAVVSLDAAVAVVADNYWSAKKGLDALEIEWDNHGHESVSDSHIQKILRSSVDNSTRVFRDEGDANSALSQSPDVIQAEYRVPFQAHAAMEPINCTVRLHDGQCDIWVPTQSPSNVQKIVFNSIHSGAGKWVARIKRKLSGGRVDSIRVHNTEIGGSFGRRQRNGHVLEALKIAAAVKAPIKLVWPREEDIQHDYYRPISFHRLQAILGMEGLPLVWSHQLSSPSLGGSPGSEDLPYQIPSSFVAATTTDVGVPTGPWRAVEHSFNAFAVECFIDELAHQTEQDPVKYRLRLLPKDSRLSHVIKLAAEKSNWDLPPSAGVFRGIAAHASFGSYVAQVAEIAITETGNIRVQRVVCAFDCGLMVNPDTVKAQIEGGIIFGLTATIKSSITINEGQVEQSNFHNFPLLRMDETPKIEIHLVTSAESPGGVGEPPVPPIAPAVANAVYAATGNRFRSLPITSLDTMTNA